VDGGDIGRRMADVCTVSAWQARACQLSVNEVIRPIVRGEESARDEGEHKALL
jgi:hypothetical protein